MEVDFKNCQDISDFPYICRICLSKDELHPVTLCNYDDNSVVSLLKICSNIEVVDNHLFPPNICSTCLGDLIMIYKFQMKCKLTFEYLNKMLKENKDLIEVIDVWKENETISDGNVDPLSLENTSEEMEARDLQSNKTDNDCLKIQYGFIQQSDLQVHLKVHNKNTKQRRTMTAFKCDYCERQFKIKHFYKNHLKEAHREHYKEHYDDNEKEFSCDKCEKICSSKSNLKKHMVRHGEKHVLCPDCGKKFYTESACISHQRVHTGEKPFECNVCGKTFRYQSSVDMHKRVHDGVRAYFCKECPKIFKKPNHLKNHIKCVHTDEKSHTCLYCKRSFTLKHNLIKHIRTHTVEKPFPCPVCNKGFINSRSIKRHIKSQHTFCEINNVSLSKDTQ